MQITPRHFQSGCPGCYFVRSCPLGKIWTQTCGHVSIVSNVSKIILCLYVKMQCTQARTVIDFQMIQSSTLHVYVITENNWISSNAMEQRATFSVIPCQMAQFEGCRPMTHIVDHTGQWTPFGRPMLLQNAEPKRMTPELFWLVKAHNSCGIHA